MDYSIFLDWIYSFFKGLASAGTWLITPIDLGAFSIAPLYLISFTGLTAFIIVAAVKWITA